MASHKINQRSREKPPIKPFLPILEESGNRPQFLAEQRLGGDKRVEFSKGAQYMFQGPRRSHDSNSIQCRFLQDIISWALDLRLQSYNRNKTQRNATAGVREAKKPIETDGQRATRAVPEKRGIPCCHLIATVQESILRLRAQGCARDKRRPETGRLFIMMLFVAMLLITMRFRT